jgi:uncharacterized membrane protein
MADTRDVKAREFLTTAGIFFGLGLGGFFDGIVFHQILQWHHMLSGWYPIDSIENLKLNTLWDGIFHSSTYLFVIAGLFILWRTSHKRHLYWSNKLLWGSIILGFGVFNCLEGIIDHQILGVHHVNEQVPASQRLAWDIGFLIWGALMVVVGWMLWRSGRTEFDARADSANARNTR